MTPTGLNRLSRRERQMMTVIYRLGEASAKEVLEGLDDPPGYSAVRATLRLLEKKGYLRHRQEGARYIYLPKVAADKARKSALDSLLATFFGGSAEQAVTALIHEKTFDDDELERLASLIERAKREGR